MCFSMLTNTTCFSGIDERIWQQRQIWKTSTKIGASPRCLTSSRSPLLTSPCPPHPRWAAWSMVWTSCSVTACRRTLLWVSHESWSIHNMYIFKGHWKRTTLIPLTYSFSDKKSQVQWWIIIRQPEQSDMSSEKTKHRDITNNINEYCQPTNLDLWISI